MAVPRPIIPTPEGVLALAAALPEADRIALLRDLVSTIHDPAQFAALSAVGRDIEAAALRLARIGFEREC